MSPPPRLQIGPENLAVGSRSQPNDEQGGRFLQAAPTERVNGDLAGAIHAELSRLETLDLDDLRIRYRQLTRKTAPAHLPRWMLMRIAAYRVQAKAFGDLDTEALKYLARVAKALEAEKKKAGSAQDGKPRGPRRKTIPPVPPVAPKTRFKPGTLLVREHAGELHRVVVMEQGFAWNGASYRSLSEVARAITGTVWNGPYFFGLRSKKSETARGDEIALAGDGA